MARPAGRPRLTVLVPAYNEAGRIGGTLPVLAAALARQGVSWELLVVDDGSTDGTREILAKLARRLPRTRILTLARNRGKGAAVRAGLKAARGAAVVFTDADLSTPPAEIPNALRRLAAGADVAIGSRALPGSRLPVAQPVLRRLSGRVFNQATRVLLGLPFADTQCGFKAFTARAARLLARTGREDGFAFDVELLLLARRHGLRVAEFPITWSDRLQTKVSLTRHAPRMFGALLALKRRFADAIAYHPARALPLILFSCGCAVVGQILYKTGALAIQGQAGMGAGFLAAMAASRPIQAGLAFFLLSAVTWILALARVDLSFAFPMLSLNFVFTALWARYAFAEVLAPARVLGIALVVCGVLVIAAGGAPAPDGAGKDR